MKARTRITAAQYNDTPPEARPAMDTLEAVVLYQDFVARRLPIPDEVAVAAQLQVNEGMPAGWTAALEQYGTRVRVHAQRKG